MYVRSPDRVAQERNQRRLSRAVLIVGAIAVPPAVQTIDAWIGIPEDVRNAAVLVLALSALLGTLFVLVAPIAYVVERIRPARGRGSAG